VARGYGGPGIPRWSGGFRGCPPRISTVNVAVWRLEPRGFGSALCGHDTRCRVKTEPSAGHRTRCPVDHANLRAGSTPVPRSFDG